MAICQHCSIQLQKKWNLIQKQPCCKKSVWPPRRPLRKKMWNPRWRPRNGCDGRLIAKVLIMTIQLNLVLNPSETWRRQHNFTWIVVIKFFAINLPSQPFLGCHLGFHIFFTMAFLRASHFFLQLGYFWIKSTLPKLVQF